MTPGEYNFLLLQHPEPDDDLGAVRVLIAALCVVVPGLLAVWWWLW